MAGAHKVVTREEWITERTAFLAKEKEFTRARDALNEARRALPWELVEKDYVFTGAKGPVTLGDLFDGRGQLIVYHFMFSPTDTQGCRHCSFWADNFNPIIVHLNQRDASMVAVSRAPYEKLAAYQARMGWNFTWVSSGETPFNFDYQASFHPRDLANKRVLYNFTMQDPGPPDREGVSVFLKDSDGRIYHTYSAYARGIDLLNTAYNYMDLLPKGRAEGDRGPSWVRRHDEYGR